jgi:hypothetical protein
VSLLGHLHERHAFRRELQNLRTTVSRIGTAGDQAALDEMIDAADQDIRDCSSGE